MANSSGESLRRGDHVVANEDLIGVPEGSAGRVELVNGFRWKRYWVRFENGVVVGSIDRALLTRVNKQGVPA